MANFFLHDGYAVTAPGLGAANCPSVEQMQGIDDVNDPCQVAAGVTASGMTIVPPAIMNPTPAVLAATMTPSGLIVPGAAAPSNMNTYLLVGAGALALLLIVGGRRR